MIHHPLTQTDLKCWRVQARLFGERLERAYWDDSKDFVRSQICAFRDDIRKVCEGVGVHWDDTDSIDNMIRRLEGYLRDRPAE